MNEETLVDRHGRELVALRKESGRAAVYVDSLASPEAELTPPPSIGRGHGSINRPRFPPPSPPTPAGRGAGSAVEPEGAAALAPGSGRSTLAQKYINPLTGESRWRLAPVMTEEGVIDMASLGRREGRRDKDKKTEL